MAFVELDSQMISVENIVQSVLHNRKCLSHMLPVFLFLAFQNAGPRLKPQMRTEQLAVGISGFMGACGLLGVI